MKRFALLLVLVLLVAPAIFAAEDLAGKWIGTMVVTMDANPPRSDPAFLVLKQAGTTLTGTAGPNEDKQSAATVKGTVETVKKDGKDVTDVRLDVTNGDAMALRFAMTLVNGHLKGSAQSESDGHRLTAALDLTRVK
jgi:hypothetical protein